MKIMLVDDQALFLEGMQHLLTSHGFEVVGSAGDGLEALIKARVLRPDVIMMDIQMPCHNGLEATRRIKAEMPEIKIVMLTVSGEDDDLFEAIKVGASGYLLKNLDGKGLCELLWKLDQGEPPLSRGLATRILEEYARSATMAPSSRSNSADEDETPRDQLTPRQKEILTLVAQGCTYKEIASELFLSQSTVKYHMSEILGRLHLRHRSEAIAYAQRTGLAARTARRPDLRLVS